MTTRPFVDKNGKTLTPGVRVKFNVATHYVNTREGTGVVTGFTDYGTVLIESDEPIGMGDPVKYTTKIGVNAKYVMGKLRAWKADRPMDYGRSEWVEIA